MQIGNFRDMYIAELQELYSVESQLVRSLPGLAEVATDPDLKDALLQHFTETQAQKARLEAILRQNGADPKVHTDQAMQALIAETAKMLKILDGGDLRDAGLIASAQKVEHYEIAAYGTAAALAGQLDLRDDQTALHQSLDEERAADAKLTEIAERQINARARAA
jgi:ferritin-like metal-binding protein YciE